MNDYLPEICSVLPELKSVTSIRHINAGYSSDYKYKITANFGLVYLLRITNPTQLNRKHMETTALTELVKLGVKCSRPIVSGLTTDGNCYYSLLTWIPGQEASKVLPDLNKGQQYSIGYAAGLDLKKMHLLKAPDSLLPWDLYFKKKWHLYQDIYFQDSLRIKNETCILDFIENHISLIKDRPITFQHDDFHLDNIIVNNNSYAGTVDFNRSYYGDPWHDFAKMFFYSSQISPSFCRGQLNGYFKDKRIPLFFWKITSLYTAVLIVNTISWIKKVSPQHIKQMLERINKVMDSYRTFSLYKPEWV